MVKKQHGFSLVELIVGLVITALALAFLSTVFFSSPQRSVEPLLQIRAVEFAQSLMDEILAKPFDENTPLGGVSACSPATTSCTTIVSLGQDSENRPEYDDVDDYDNYCNPASSLPLVDAEGNTPLDGFDDFGFSVCVDYDGDYDGNLNEAGAVELNAKRIRILVRPPIGDAIEFTAYRGNF